LKIFYQGVILVNLSNVATTRNNKSKVKCMAEETNKNQIVPLKNNSLAKASSTLALTNKLLQEIENRNTLPSNDFRVSIPDINFQKYLTDTFEIVITDNSVAYGDINHIEKINCSSKEGEELNKIKSLEGLQHFTALTSLGCHHNQLTDLDVSQNTALTILRCDHNQLMDLDLSQNTALTILRCDHNQLTNLDLSQNTALTLLWCCENQLTDLDVSKNTALTDLRCHRNQITDLDVSKNTTLACLLCDNNQLTELDLSQNTELGYLSCRFNILKDLDVSQNTELFWLLCDSNQLTNIDVSKNTALSEALTTVDKNVNIHR
jgi:hypothetical protein